MKRLPEHLGEIGQVGSNLDTSLNEGSMLLLDRRESFAQYSAWNFCGFVWVDDDGWNMEIWRHNAHVATLTAPTMVDLRDAAIEMFGRQ